MVTPLPPTNIDLISSPLSQVKRFSTLDYVLFGASLLLSLIIGSAYAFVGGKQKTAREFLMGNNEMGIFPVGASLVASFVSAIAILGTGVEIYLYGTQYWTIVISYGFVIGIANYFYLPVFYHLKLTSTYEYLERRFHRNVRIAGAFTFVLQMVFYLSIVLYAPCLALNQVTGFSVTWAILISGIICTFYTSIGGIKAVMWTDAFQIVIMFAGVIAVIIRGIHVVGGMSVIWERNYQGARLQQIDFNFDPFVRYTFWTLVIGGFFTWLAIYGVNQAKVQRCLSCPTLLKAQLAMWINFPSLVLIMSLCCYSGLVMYAHYYKCDPITSGKVKAPDQILPLFVMDVLNFPGLPGLFVSALFCGALSTMSSGINALAAVTLEDFVKIFINPNISETKGGIVSKIVAAAFGAILISLAFVASHLGGVLQAALSIFGMIGGPLLGLFTLGMFFPCANSIGSFIGWILGLIFSFWVGIGSTIHRQPIIPRLKLNIDGCFDFNKTHSITNHSVFLVPRSMNESLPPTIWKGGNAFKIYQLSYLYFSVLSTLSVVVIGLVMSLVVKLIFKSERNRHPDPSLISPPIRKLLYWLSSSQSYKLNNAIPEVLPKNSLAMKQKNG